MIQVICPNCHGKFSASEKLIGRTGKCPTCSGPITITAAEPKIDSDVQATVLIAEAIPDQHVHDALDHELPSIKAPEFLARQNRYIICEPNGKIFATWQNDGHSWMLRTSSGYIRARRNPEKLPAQGIFSLVELKMTLDDGASRLTGIAVFDVMRRWAMTSLDQGDHQILKKLNGPGRMTHEQKNAVRQFLRDTFMHQIWADSHDVLEFLSNSDYHSSGVG